MRSNYGLALEPEAFGALQDPSLFQQHVATGPSRPGASKSNIFTFGLAQKVAREAELLFPFVFDFPQILHAHSTYIPPLPCG